MWEVKLLFISYIYEQFNNFKEAFLLLFQNQLNTHTHTPQKRKLFLSRVKVGAERVN